MVQVALVVAVQVEMVHLTLVYITVNMVVAAVAVVAALLRPAEAMFLEVVGAALEA